MESTYYSGDVIIVKNKSRVKLEVNDIIAFREDNKVVTHRIIDKTDKGYLTKGDNNQSTDKKVLLKEDVIGEVYLQIPKVG